MKFLALVLVTLLVAPSPVNSWGLFDNLANVVKGTASGLASGIAGVGNFAGNVVAGTAGGVASVANAAGNVVGNTVTGVGNVIGSLFGGGEGSGSIEVNLDPGAVIEGAGNVIKGGLEAVGNFGISLGKAFEGKFNFDDALGKARNYWLEVGGRLKGKIGGAANSIGEIIQNAGELVRPTFDRSGKIVGYISVNVEGNLNVDLSAPVYYKFGDLVVSLGAAVNGARNKVVGVWDKFGNKLEGVADSFSTSLARAVEAAGSLAGSAVQGVGSAVGGAVATAGQLIDSAINNLGLTWDDEFDGKFDFGDALGKSWRFWNDLKVKFAGKGKRVANAIGDIISSVGEAVRPTFDRLGNIAGYVSIKVDGNWDQSKPVYYRFGNLIISLGSSVGGGWNNILGVWDRFGYEVEGGVDDLTYALTKAFNAAENVVGNLGLAVGEAVGAAGNAALNIGGALGNLAGNVIGGAVEGVAGLLNGGAKAAAYIGDTLRSRFGFRFDPSNTFLKFDLGDAIGRSWNSWGDLKGKLKGKVGGGASALGELIGKVGAAVKPNFDFNGNIVGFASINLGAGFNDLTKPAYFKFGNFIVNLGGSTTGVRNKIIGLWDHNGIKLEGAIDKFVNFLTGAFDAAGELAADTANNFGAIIQGLGNALGGAVNVAGNLVGGALDAAGNLAGNVVSNVGGALGGAVNVAGDVLGSLFNNLYYKIDYPFKGRFEFSDALKTSWNFWGDLKNRFNGKVGGAVNAIGELIHNAGQLVRPTFDGLGNIKGYVSIRAEGLDLTKPLYYKFGNLIVSLGNVAGGVRNKVLGLWDAKGSKYEDGSVDDFVVSLSGALDATVNLVGNAVGGLGAAVGGAIDTAGNVVSNVGGAIGNLAGNLFGGAVEGVAGLLNGGAKAAAYIGDTLRSRFGFRFDPSNTFLKFDLGDAIGRSWNSWGDLKGKLKGKVGGGASALGELIGKVGVAVKPNFDFNGNIVGFASINLGVGFDDLTKPAYFKFGNFIVNLGGSTTGVRNKIIGLWDHNGIKLEGAIDKFVNFLTGAFEAAGELAADTANNFGAIIQGLGNALGGAVNVAGNLVGGALDVAGNIAGNVVSNVGGALGNLAGGIAGSLGNAAEANWSFWNNVGNGLKFATGGVANAVGNVANAAGGALGSAAGAVGNVVGGAANIAANFADRLRSKFAFKFDPKNTFGQFDLGDALGRSWNFWSNFNANIKGKVGGVANAIGEIIGSVGEAVKPNFDASGNIAGFVSINLGAGFDDFSKPAYFKFGNFIVNLGGSTSGVRNKIIGLWDAKGIKLEGAIDKFVNFLSGAFEGAAELAGEAASNLGVAVGTLGNAVGGALNTAAQLIGSLFNNFELNLDYPFKGKFDFGSALKTSWNFWGNLKSKLKGKADVSAVCDIISQAGILVKPTFDAFGNINGYVSINAGVKIDFSKPVYYKFGNLVVSLGSTSGGVLNKVLGLWDAKGFKIQASVDDFVASLIGALDGAWAFAKGVSVKLGVSLGDLAAGLSGTLRIDGEAGWSLLNKLKAGVEGAVGIAGDIVGGVGNAVGQVVGATGNAVGQVVGATGNAVGQVVGATGNAVGQVVGATGNAVGNIVAGAGNVGAGLFGGLWNTVGGLAHGAVGVAGSEVNTLFPEGR
ncbi:uncharacterized protein LOC131948285 [Physella acuta]|uniref:uncharacterized protein LOC131948285 n=1 Tax=Physella acuta TaxID=109671 RepID=UPI0027DDD570|nr:uncharacterized protein LOC131948285 [Physella acuta]